MFIHTIATTSYHSVVFYTDIEENGEYKHVLKGLYLQGRMVNKATVFAVTHCPVLA